VTAIGTRSAIFISTMPTVRVCGSSPIGNKEPRTFKTGPRHAHIWIAGEVLGIGPGANLYGASNRSRSLNRLPRSVSTST